MFVLVNEGIRRLFRWLGFALMLLITAVDALLGARVILIALLRSRQPRSVASPSAWPSCWHYQTESGLPRRSSLLPAPC
jgi:hypothetical protein